MSTDGLLPVSEDYELGPTVRSLAAGQKLFGRYVLKSVLGRSGMGVVWLAGDKKLERDVALKFLPEMVKLDPGALDDLKRETRRSLDLTHPHIVRVYDFVQDGSLAGISMEYIKGKTLSAKRVEKSNRVFDAEELGLWIEQACDALEYAHKKAKIVHRDLKPANLMVTDEGGELKIADFGIARSVSDSMSRVTSRPGGTSGTLVYMSPQQLMGAAPSITDDIYSLGATIYELMTGKPPFHTGEIITQVQSIVPCRMAERREALGMTGGKIPEKWEETIAACLAKDAAARPQSAAELAFRLKSGSKLIKQAPIPRPRQIDPAPLRKSEVTDNGRKRRPFGAALVLLALITVAVIVTIQSVQLTRTPLAVSSTKQGWQNSLGMKFVPAGTTNVLFSVYDTRVKDFQDFVDATGYDATAGCYSPGSDGWKQRGDNWNSPGFSQGPEYPVVGVSWYDAKAFCQWLTDKEHKGGGLNPNQSYRLPTDAEWSKAAGLEESPDGTPASKNGKIEGIYPWGTSYPPPADAGNYNRRGDGNPFSQKSEVSGTDRFAYSSPVGSFPANQYGLYDMGGNAWQWCEDWFDTNDQFRLLRGASWGNDAPRFLRASSRANRIPADRYTYYGFRVVLAVP